MELKKLLTGVENYKSKGDMEIEIKKVECNSKKVVPNSLFIAIKGYDFDEEDLIDNSKEDMILMVMNI